MERSTHTLAVKSQKWLVQALLSLIQQKPYEEISISELCKAAGLDRRTFYRNFKNKTDVLLFYFFKTAQSDQALIAALFQMLNTFIPAIYAGADGSIPKELRYNVAFVVGGFYNSLIQWITTGFHETAEEIAAIVSQMFRDSISYWPIL